MPIKNGDKVKIDYTGTLEDKTVFDTSEGKQPIEFEVGTKQVIKGFEEAVIGMEKGDEKEITIKPEDAYGEPRAELTQKIPRDKLPAEPEPKEGMVLGLQTPDGKQLPARIVTITDTEVTIDLNHPLAGKTLNFKIKVVDVS